MDRSGADVRGVIHKDEVAHVTHKVAGVVIDDKEESKAAPKKKAAKKTDTKAPADSLEAVFESFAHGAKEIDGKTFAKFAKDCKVLNKGGNQDTHHASGKEESVEELMQKLAKKGKKVKLLDESASVKELPK